jgi:hypothetical protein
MTHYTRDLRAQYSKSYSAWNYPEIAAAVIKEMHRNVGELQVDSKGIARRGLSLS